LKKRTKKLLPFGIRGLAGLHTKVQKSFASFLQKRRPFWMPPILASDRPGVVGRRAILPAKAKLGLTAAILGGFVLVFGLEYLTWYYI
jgi:hypothetical protein